MMSAMSSADQGSSGRWFALGAFSLLVVCTQLFWLTFASVSTQAEKAYGVSAGAIGDLAVINPATFVILAIPAGGWMDRNYERTLLAGALFTAVGAVIRAIDPHSYPVAVVGQVVMSVGQPLTLNALTKIAARYFPAREQTTAISIGSAAQFVGILLAVLTSKSLVDAGGFGLLLSVHAAIGVVAAVLVIASLRVPVREDAVVSESHGLGWIRGDRVLWWMAGLLFIGFGVYNALATWLDAIMSAFGHANVGGPLIAVLTVAGIVGAAIIPGFAAARDVRRGLCLVATGVMAVAMLILVWQHHPVVAGIVLAATGLVLLGLLPVVLDWSELRVGAARAGTATGFLLLAGNLGGVVVVLTVQVIAGTTANGTHLKHASAALLVMALWAIPGLFFASRLPKHVAGHDELTRSGR